MTNRSNRPDQLALGPQAVAEFFKPARLELYDCLQACGPASVADLAVRLGRPADALYYHLRKLEQLGVLERLKDRAAGEGEAGRNGAIYAATSRSVVMRLDPGSAASRRAWLQGAQAVHRMGSRNVESALESGSVRTEGPDRNLTVQRVRARLGPDELREVNRLLDELSSLLRGHSNNAEGQVHALTLTLCPLEERAR
ncbi:winged helix-turn-helix domain-containing protein [Engelhardtia mirabilis]|uniref:Helix-turn-helix domain protein n=1 Tax=Engelhardtia mirabilis TaxID=2528011 RepID=A0A518BMS5_9BACT|nr:Helix-turn-helix domain protein [Planctomycetes bacterium Pla133]QDV02583.1 Helix-turn-helix domain protein [Planctomycetes bacterium Pla86]